MTTPEDSNMKAILGKIGAITAQAADDDYIFRGESECYEKVTSNLYRHYGNNFEAMQRDLLKDARQYIDKTDKTDDFEILSKLQHYGSKTNLIDFTADLHIALFFACGHPNKNGRVILLSRKVMHKTARRPKNRVIPQKSIFVQPLKGFIEPELVKFVLIPKELKLPMLDYLEKFHDITTKTLFKDINGFMALQRIHGEAYTEFSKGITSLEQKDYDGAIDHFTKSIKLKSDVSPVYNNRGVAHGRKDDFKQAIIDFGKAIELDSNNATAYFNRAVNLLIQQEWDKAKSDLHNSKYRRFDITGEFSEEHSSIVDFEKKHDLQLPEDIKEMLTPQQDVSG